MTGLEIVLMVLGILVLVIVVNVLVWIPIARKLKHMTQVLREELDAGGEPAVRGPELGNYRGATAEYGQVKGNGVIALTAKRLVFRKAFGKAIEVPLDQVTGVREAKWFHRSTVGRIHMIVQTRSGAEVGFLVKDHAAWMATMQEIAARS